MEAEESSQARAWLFEETAGRQGTGANVIPGGREGTSLSKSGCTLSGKKMREEGISALSPLLSVPHWSHPSPRL